MCLSLFALDLTDQLCFISEAQVADVHVVGDGERKFAVLEEVSLDELLASADLGRGARQFNKCAACHKLEEGANGTGPHLYGVVGRPKASVDGFGYSGAIGTDDVWSPENLSAFIENPRGYAPGTSMAFAGLKSPEDRADLIAYLDSIDN